ncbi:MAG: CvpA family protein [Chitinophagaceae bacterium]|nr:CvpA family protein [Chitinophagaceae bacterium]
MFIDIIFAAILILACIKGFQKGLIVALFSILAFIVGLAAALKLSAAVAGWLGNSISVSAKWLPFIAFAVVFLLVVLLVKMGAKIIEKTFQMALLGWINRLGGIVFFLALYTIIFSIFLFYAEKVQLIQPSVIQASATYSIIQPWGPKVINGIGVVIPIFKDMFTDLSNFFGTVSTKIPQ